MDTTYYEFIEKLKGKFGSFVMDADAGVENKSAALRARKLSMELRKDFQDFRKISVSNDSSRTKHRAKEETDAVNPAV
jgi:hypothetical protein